MPHYLNLRNLFAFILKVNELCLERRSHRSGGERKEGYRILDGIIKGRGERYYEACMTKGDFLAEDGDLSNAALNYQAAAKCDNGNREPIMRLVELYGGAGMDQTADMWREWLDMK